jgi:hypothetical protein
MKPDDPATRTEAINRAIELLRQARSNVRLAREDVDFELRRLEQKIGQLSAAQRAERAAELTLTALGGADGTRPVTYTGVDLATAVTDLVRQAKVSPPTPERATTATEAVPGGVAEMALVQGQPITAPPTITVNTTVNLPPEPKA